MAHRKVKSLTCLVLCLALLSGCSGKEENQNITEPSTQTESTVKLDAPVKADNITNNDIQAVTEEASTTTNNTQPDNEKEVVDTKTNSQQTKDVKPVILTEEEFYSRDIIIPDDKPFEMTISFGVVNITAAINQVTGDMYYNFAGNEFMYIDGVNYLIDKNNPIKYKGSNVMLNNTSGASSVSVDTDVEESLSILDTLKITDISVVSDIIIVNGDISYSGTITPATLKIDYNTYEFISLTMNQDSTYVYLNILDSWNDLPDFNYKEVDAETIEEKAKQSILMVMAGAFSSAFSEESLTGLDSTTELDNSDSNKKSTYRYEIKIDGITEDSAYYIRDLTKATLCYDYSISGFNVSLEDSSYNIYASRELSDKELSSLKNEIIEYLESKPEKYVEE